MSALFVPQQRNKHRPKFAKVKGSHPRQNLLWSMCPKTLTVQRSFLTQTTLGRITSWYPKINSKPFWLATQLYPQNDQLVVKFVWMNYHMYDVYAQTAFSSDEKGMTTKHLSASSLQSRKFPRNWENYLRRIFGPARCSSTIQCLPFFIFEWLL